MKKTDEDDVCKEGQDNREGKDDREGDAQLTETR
jgi:hypothetical protein